MCRCFAIAMNQVICLCCIISLCVRRCPEILINKVCLLFTAGILLLWCSRFRPVCRSLVYFHNGFIVTFLFTLKSYSFSFMHLLDYRLGYLCMFEGFQLICAVLLPFGVCFFIFLCSTSCVFSMTYFLFLSIVVFFSSLIYFCFIIKQSLIFDRCIFLGEVKL